MVLTFLKEKVLFMLAGIYHFVNTGQNRKTFSGWFTIEQILF